MSPIAPTISDPEPKLSSQRQCAYEHHPWTGRATILEAVAQNNPTRTSNRFYLAVIADTDGCYTATVMKGRAARRQKRLSPDSYAFVKVTGEPHLRVALKGAKFGEAAGHPHLAFEGPVAYAGRGRIVESHS